MEELENTSAALEKWVWRKCNEMKSDKRLKKLQSYVKATVRTTDSTRTKKKKPSEKVSNNLIQMAHSGCSVLKTVGYQR